MCRVLSLIILIFVLILINNHQAICLNLNPFQKTVPDTLQGIKDQGFPGEKHRVKTDDGYLLTIFRIPSLINKNKLVERLVSNFSNNKKQLLPVILQHGLHGSSDNFIVDITGLAFQLSKEGYDVWLGNIRGNAYSRDHETLSPNEEDFWNYSWHEMGMHDMPAIIDYILKKTGQKQLHYIGHSMGTTMFYVMTSEIPRYNNKIRTMISLSPVARMTKWLPAAPNASMIYNILNEELNRNENQGNLEMLPRPDVEGESSHQATCTKFSANFIPFCFSLLGFLQHAAGPTVPGGSSVKTSKHYLQLVGTGTFKHFDFEDDVKNIKMWGSPEPPKYDLEKVTAPVAIFYTPSDELISAEDAEYMIETLPNVIKTWRAPEIGFSHFDFVFSTTMLGGKGREEMKDEIINLLKNRNN
ncbi:lipase 1-like [Lycorma delicatula]|uniref:lipase 1-like n=1 Tax=Lycorma delicatula TaxID=130591 RepID=UPI003F515210